MATVITTTNTSPFPDLKPIKTHAAGWLYGGRKAELPLHVLVIGCGLGGLATAFCMAQAGHRVTVLESASEIGEVGAGIQVSPNLTRLLIRWGAGERLAQVGVKPGAITFRRYNDGETVGWTRWGNTMEEQYDAPYYHIHRADLHQILFDLAQPHMTLRLNSRVVDLDAAGASVKLSTGEVVRGDVIIGADGVKSTLREFVIGKPDKPTPTGDATYRAIVPTSELMKHEDLRPLVETPEMVGWMGPGRHIMAYCIRAKKEYNLVLIHPDDGSVESWTEEGSADKMREDFAGWEPRITKLLSMIPSTLKWKLMDRAPLDTWVHPEGNVALLGDACHPMLPYRAQGSAMAVEDAAVLGNLFSRISHRSQITPMLHAYQRLRYARTTDTQHSSRLNQHIFHLPDGPEQQARDASMRVAMKAELEGTTVDTSENRNQWADKEKSKRQFGYDADREANVFWEQEGQKTIGSLSKRSRL